MANKDNKIKTDPPPLIVGVRCIDRLFGQSTREVFFARRRNILVNTIATKKTKTMNL